MPFVGPPNEIVMIVVIVMLLVAGLKSLNLRSTGQQDYHYRRKPIMTANEARFFTQLRLAFPQQHVFPQVSMGAIVAPAYDLSDRRHRPCFQTVAQKRIDFVLCDVADLSVTCVIELDDRSHDSQKDKRRDAITASAGYQTVRIAASRSYEPGDIRRKVTGLLGPAGKL